LRGGSNAIFLQKKTVHYDQNMSHRDNNYLLCVIILYVVIICPRVYYFPLLFLFPLLFVSHLYFEVYVYCVYCLIYIKILFHNV